MRRGRGGGKEGEEREDRDKKLEEGWEERERVGGKEREGRKGGHIAFTCY